MGDTFITGNNERPFENVLSYHFLGGSQLGKGFLPSVFTVLLFRSFICMSLNSQSMHAFKDYHKAAGCWWWVDTRRHSSPLCSSQWACSCDICKGDRVNGHTLLMYCTTSWIYDRIISVFSLNINEPEIIKPTLLERLRFHCHCIAVARNVQPESGGGGCCVSPGIDPISLRCSQGCLTTWEMRI